MKEGTAARRSLPFDAVSGMLPSAHAKRAGRAGLDLTPVSAKQTGIEFTVLLQPATEAILVDLLSDLPAPQFWDAGGLADSPIQVTHLARYSQGNRIILYGSLP